MLLRLRQSRQNVGKKQKSMFYLKARREGDTFSDVMHSETGQNRDFPSGRGT